VIIGVPVSSAGHGRAAASSRGRTGRPRRAGGALHRRRVLRDVRAGGRR
jgi:hypothetical protein